jgi:ketosteroid isomerase-like protein
MAMDHRSDEEIVRGLDDLERVAALGRDIPALSRLWSEDFVVNAPNNQVVSGKNTVLATFVEAGIIDFSSFERQIEFVRKDHPFVVLMGLEIIVPLTTTPGAGLAAGQRVTRRFTNIWKNEGDTWRLAIRHANVFAGI